MKNNINNLELKTYGNLVPLIFTKKVNDNTKVIPLNETRNTLGSTRHFPAATKEWFNSIYAYNNNYVKSLSPLNKTLSNLIKSYFNLYLKKKVSRSKRLALRFRRLSLQKIFVGKAELKHTSDKVIITLYVYNEGKRNLMKKITETQNLFSKNKNTPSSSFIKSKLDFLSKTLDKRSSIFVKEIEKVLNLLIEKREEGKTLTKGELSTMNSINKLNEYLLSLENNNARVNFWKFFFIKNDLEKQIKELAEYKLLLNINRSKFENTFLNRFKPLIGKILNKEVEFNIINLKSLSFDSNIFTQAIAMKLKNRDNRLLRVLRSSLNLVKLPSTNRIREKYGNTRNDFTWLNRVKNLKINNSVESKKDVLSLLFSDVFSKPVLNTVETNEIDAKRSIKLSEFSNKAESIVLNNLKYKMMAGARLEAKGRLTRRFTASRAVFKVKWKGSLKNIDSSYRGLSSVILRGHEKSNVQSSFIGSKTRNGAFGLRGWISGK